MDNMYLPPEIWTNIIDFMIDKTCISMTCKLFKKLCAKVYEDSEIMYYSDSYDVNVFYNKKIIMKFIGDLKNIESYNSLNCIFHKIFFKNEQCNEKIFDLNDWYDDPDKQNDYKILHTKNIIKILNILLLQYIKTHNAQNIENLKMIIQTIELYSMYIYDMDIIDLLNEVFTQDNKEIIIILMEYKFIRKFCVKKL
jgi:hypothetical protein